MNRPVPFLDLRVLHDEIRDELEEVFSATIDGSAFVGGELVDRFEAQFASYCGRAHAIGVGNGTDALELALQGLGVGVGDEVIVPANTFYATVEAVYRVGATPLFVDVDPHTLLVSPTTVEGAITRRTAAVIVVHLFGQPVDLDGFEALCARAGIPLVEDAAQAHGARWGHRPAGAVGTAACFSFYPGKNLGALGDGGAVVTDDPELAAAIRSLSNHGRSATAVTGHGRPGRNSRLDGLQAGVLSRKLPRLDAWNGLRREAWAVYERGFDGSPVVPVVIDDRATSAMHLAVVRVPRRDAVRHELSRMGVATGIHYPLPCHRLPPLGDTEHAPLPESEWAAGEILSLPMYPQLGTAGAQAVVDRLCHVVQSLGVGHRG